MFVEGFSVTPMVRLHIRWEDEDTLYLLNRFEREQGIAGRTFRGGSGGPYERVAFYTAEDAALVAEFLKARGLKEKSEGRMNWDRLDRVQKQALLEEEHDAAQPTA